MKDITRKVVILENLSSPYVHQAIIVMRKYDPKLESYAVTEAERIVNAYLDNMKLHDSKHPRPYAKKLSFIIFAVIAAALIAAAVITGIRIRF